MENLQWSPYEKALWDYYTDQEDRNIIIHANNLSEEELPVSYYYRGLHELPQLEKLALDLCKGHVLDVGAGVGSHCLLLKDKGHDVSATDVAPKAIEIMKLRGVKDSHCANFYQFSGQKFDTLLMLMNGIGFVETLDGLDLFFQHAKSLIHPDGQIILDSSDVRLTLDPLQKRFQTENKNSGKYFGEYHFQFEYDGIKGQKFPWLFVDANTLLDHAEENGWKSSTIYQITDESYLAQLSLDK